MGSPRRILIALLLTLAASPLFAQPAYRVKDLNPNFDGPAPCCLVGDGSRLYFQANDGAHGGEAWVSDGTFEGTFLLVDAVAGPGSFSPRFFVRAGAQVFYTGMDPLNGIQLWKTDGTSSGTSLVRAIGPPSGGYEIQLVALGNNVLFAGLDENGVELWISDGTTAGTHILRDINVGPGSSQPQSLAVVKGVAYFSASDGLSGAELWRTDGTEAGTTRVRDIYPGATGSAPSSLVAFGDRLIFAATDADHGRELWTSDGTEDGTTLVADIRPGGASSSPGSLAAADRAVFFRANDGVHGPELWRSDGTLDGTKLVKDIETEDPAASGPDWIVAAGDRVFFRWKDQGPKWGFWASDGTDAGTVQVASGQPWGLAAERGRGFFSILRMDWKGDLWSSDGSVEGTRLVRTFAPPSIQSTPNSLTFMGATLCFVAGDGALGAQLWRSDGTPEGTTVVRSMNPGAAWSDPRQFVEAAGKLFFLAKDELWQSDGTEEGTKFVSRTQAEALASVGGRVFFFGPGLGAVLWESDGTVAGTKLVGGQTDSYPLQSGQAVSSGARAFWTTRKGNEDPVLWATDTEVPATGQVLRSFAQISKMVSAPEGMLFGAGETVFFQDLWASDGTPLGTRRVRALNSELPIQIIRCGGRFFLLVSVQGYPANHRQLWVTDGTDPGTRLVWDFGPWPVGGVDFVGSVRGVVLLNASGETRDLWRSDGTPAGTFLVHSFGTAGLGEFSTSLDGGFFALAPDGGTRFQQLWTTDGSVSGTRLVRDLANVAASYLPPIGKLLDVGGTLIFGLRADADAQLWRSDGTPAGTALFQSGVSAENPVYYLPPPGLAVKDRVFFAGYDRFAGSELWALPVSSAFAPHATLLSLLAPCRAVDTRNVSSFTGGPMVLAGVPRVFPVGDVCGIPWTTRALAANVTVTGATADGLLRIHASDIGAPEASVINFRAGQTRANNATIALGPDAEFTVRYETSTGTGEVHVIVDVVGYYE